MSLATKSTRNSKIEKLLLLGTWVVFLVLALRTFGPDSVYTNYSSDSAIPVLMANDDRKISVFDTYYYAADRWGGWPMVIGKAVHLNTGFVWTDQRVHYTRTIWLFLGLLALAALNGRAAPAVIVSGLIVICLEHTSRRLAFDLSQLYSWQVPALFIAWVCARRVLTQPSRIFWSVAFYCSALLAIWSSVASAPLLTVVITLEALRSHFLIPRTINKRRIAIAVVLLLAATASEYLMKLNYHRFSFKRFGHKYNTSMVLDFGYLHQNLLANWDNIVQYHFFPFIVVAICFFAGTVGLMLYALVTRRRSLASRFFEDESATMIVVLTAMAATNFALITSINHVRTSFYDVRFHTPTYLFAAISGLLVIYLVIRVLAERLDVTRYAIPIVVAGAFVILAINFPPRVLSEVYKLEHETALTLSQKAPRSVLMGRYWQTYLFAGLQPTNTMTPLPVEGELNRMPWTEDILDNSQQVVVEYRKSELLDDELLPPREFRQYENLLRLKDAHFYENGPYAFALYINAGKTP